MTHPDIIARKEQIKGTHNWIEGRYVKLVPDYNGHGTHVTGLLLDYALDAEVYIAKIADHKPLDTEIIAKVTAR